MSTSGDEFIVVEGEWTLPLQFRDGAADEALAHKLWCAGKSSTASTGAHVRYSPRRERGQ